MNKRIKKLIASFKPHGFNGFLSINDSNIKYLTQFNASESWLLVAGNKTYYITDSRYTLEAKKGLKGVVVVEFKESCIKTLFELVKKERITKLGFEEDQFTLTLFKRLKRFVPKSVKLIPKVSVVESLRMIKDETEIKKIKKALKIHAKALQYLKRIIKPGRTEREVFLKLEAHIKSQNAGFSFDPIIASGVNSCFPHASVTTRKIRNNEPVLVDFGVDIDGYKSDLTRMFFLGKIPNLVKEVSSFCKEANRKAIEIAEPGRSVGELDAAARDYLEIHGLAKYFGHALGHGVGLDIHEAPRLSKNSKTELKPGMVITIEPGIYIPDRFGVRIEDMVLITEKGCEVLSDNIN